MTETINMPKTYTNREVADLMGCTPEYVRKLKSTRKDELEGLWQVSESDKETYWTEQGLNVLASMMSTSQAKSFCAGALARRTAETIAVDRAEISCQNEVNPTSTRTGHETNAYSTKEGRYSQLPEQLGDMLSDRLINGDDAVGRMDRRVAMNLLKAANLGELDLDLDSLLK